jgi:Lon protease-like protein
VQPIEVSEPRYRDLIDQALDSSGQIVMATWSTDKKPAGAKKPLSFRDAVCLVQIMHHEHVEDGYEVLLHGICRAEIIQLHQPSDEHSWCEAIIRPLETLDEELPTMQGVRDELYDLLTGDHLQSLQRAQAIVQWFEREDVTTHALLELIGFTFVQDEETRYRFLAEPSFDGRSHIIRSELGQLDRLIGQARRQVRDDLERGMNLN